MNAVENVERGQLAQRPAIKPGDTVKVHVKVREGDKERIQVFEGIVIGLHRGGTRASFTVRKVSFGQGVERIFPLHATIVDHIDVVKRGRVRRAKLYYLRGLRGKAARIRERDTRVRHGKGRVQLDGALQLRYRFEPGDFTAIGERQRVGVQRIE